MLNEFLTALSTQLYQTFGKQYHYYIEDVEQKFSKPCFHVAMLEPLQRSTGLYKYDRTMPVVIHFFTDDENNAKKICFDMADKIADCLEYLKFKNCLIRGDDISWNVVNGNVLQFMVTYRFKTIKEIKPDDPMESVSEIVTNGLE